MTNSTKVTLYTKKIRTKDGKFFPKTLLKVGNTSMEVLFSGAVKKELEEIKKDRNLQYPLDVELTEADYFIKEKESRLEDGTLYKKRICVLLRIKSVEQGEFTKQLSIRDLL